MIFTYKPVTQSIYTLTRESILTPGIVYRFIEPVVAKWDGERYTVLYFHHDRLTSDHPMYADNTIRFYDEDGLYTDDDEDIFKGLRGVVFDRAIFIYSSAPQSLEYTISPLPPFPTVGL